MNTYVVIKSGEEEDGEKVTNIAYAGQDVEKALSFEPDTFYTLLEMQLWMNGVLIKSYIKRDIYDWVVEFDKIKNLKTGIAMKKEDIKKMQAELDEIGEIFKENS